MTWVQAREKSGEVSKYAIRNGDQVIATVYLDGCTLYELWHKDEPARYFEEEQAAKDAADELMKGETK